MGISNKLRAYIINYLENPIPENMDIVEKSVPVVFFGNAEKARFATIGINPSGLEFTNNSGVLLTGTNKRFVDRGSLMCMDTDVLSQTDAECVYESLIGYFQNNPYDWFNKMENMGNKLFGASYYNDTLVHLDIYPWATKKSWANENELIKNRALASYGLLKQIMAESPFEAIYVNGRSAKEQMEKYFNITLPIKKTVAIGKLKYEIFGGNYNGCKIIGQNASLKYAKNGDELPNAVRDVYYNLQKQNGIKMAELKKNCDAFEQCKCLKDIDVKHDFSDDCEINLWNTDNSDNDPDLKSRLLRRYHFLLWNNKDLPNGKPFKLTESPFMENYLCYNGDDTKRLGADTIVNLYTHHNNRFIMPILTKLEKDRNYQKRKNTYIHKSYTIGGNLIFPKDPKSVNQSRGNIYVLADRIDLTMECIRIWYEDKNTPTPLTNVLSADAWFFNLFGTFEEYIDFFLLQDLVKKKRGKYAVKIFLRRNTKDDERFAGYPSNVREWRVLARKEMAFLKQRNRRIKKYIHRHSAN
ncbi:MAG: hypothetical protein IJ866_01320 [Alphaproteobacteria bacterium]|nr:hypothetical protein [Alphaproteobacteria bacterium]